MMNFPVNYIILESVSFYETNEAKMMLQLQSSTFCLGCVPPAVPSQGRLEMAPEGSSDTAASLKVHCDEGHKLRQGNPERRCLVPGVWSGKDPICERKS